MIHIIEIDDIEPVHKRSEERGYEIGEKWPNLEILLLFGNEKDKNVALSTVKYALLANHEALYNWEKVLEVLKWQITKQ